MPQQKVLICGAGIAGSICAFWLAKDDFQVVIVERSRSGQKIGQGLEIEEPAVKVVKAMGVMDRLVEKQTSEEGTDIVDDKGRVICRFPRGHNSPTGALEFMRGDLTEILCRAADESDNVEYRFETTIIALKQTPEKVTAELQDRNTKSTTTEEFDFVIGADGAKSRTRFLVMGPPEEIGCYRRVGAYNSYFSIPKEDRDEPYSRVCFFPGRRIIWTRPIGRESKHTSVYCIHLNQRIPTLDRAHANHDRPKQKEAIAQIFKGLQWEAPRVMAAMQKAENFYSDDLVQVHLKKWFAGRVVLVGDAAWAPTPFTGQGNQLAIIGAWVLAQELSRNRTTEGLQMYETRLRAYVEKCQEIPLWGWAPFLFCPETVWGIWILRTILAFIALVVRLFERFGLARFLPNSEEVGFDMQMPKS